MPAISGTRDRVGRSISHYLILRQLGEGGMGVVYEARDVRLDRLVALKFVSARAADSPQAMERLVREARAISALSHPNIAVLHEIAQDEGETFLVFEHLPGGNLRQRRGLSTAAALQIGLQLADALGAAHSHGIVHRDVKPENVLFTEDGALKLIDFGLAHRSTDPHLTASGMAVGTVGYMAPEQLRGQHGDARSDVYSLGVVLKELLNRRVPDEVAPILSRALQQDPDERYQNALQFAAALRTVTAERGARITVTLTGTRPTVRLWPKASLAVALFGLASYGIFGTRSPAPMEKHLLVLPFSNIGGGPSGQAFCDGMAETVSSGLTQLEEFQGTLRVVPAADVRRQGVASAGDASRVFGVNLVVSGSIQRQERHLRATVNLIDSASLRQLGAETFAFSEAELPQIQDWAISSAARMLEVRLRPDAMSVLGAPRPQMPDAYRYSMEGRGYLARYGAPEDVASAEAAFERAIQLDSRYAPAYAGLAEALWRSWRSSRDPERLELAWRNANRALELNNRLTQAHLMIGRIRNSRGQHEEAIRSLRTVIALDPRNADVHGVLAGACESLGRFDEAEAEYQRAIDMRQSDWPGYNNLAAFYTERRRFADAEPLFRKVIELAPQNATGYRNLAGVYLLMGQYGDAIPLLRKSLDLTPTAAGYTNLGTAYYYQGRYEEAAKAMERAVERQPRSYVFWGNLGDARSRISPEGAKAAWSRAAELARLQLKTHAAEPQALSSLAVYEARLGLNRTALADIAEVRRSAPRNARVLWKAALVYEISGRRALALTALKEALAAGESTTNIGREPDFAALRRDASCAKYLTKEVCDGSK